MPDIVANLLSLLVSGGSTTPLKGVGRGGGAGGAPELQALGCVWSYAWTIVPKWQTPPVEFVPMIHLAHNAATVVKCAAVYPKGSHWLVYNEPDFKASVDYDPRAVQTVEHYKLVSDALYTYDPTAKLVLGNVFILDNGSYWPGWIRRFRANYYKRWGKWPKADGWAFHIWPTTAYNTVDWRRRALGVASWQRVDRVGGELWLTEFGWLSSTATAMLVMKEQTPWLKQQTWLTRFAWYATQCEGMHTGALLKGNATKGYSFTELGKVYVGL